MLAVLIGISVSGPRGLFAMARDRRLPAFLAAVSPKSGTPVGANIFVVACYAVFALLTVFWTGLFALPGTPHYSAMFSWGSTFGSFALGRISCRHRQPGRERRGHLRFHLQGDPSHRVRPVRGHRMVHRGPRGRPD